MEKHKESHQAFPSDYACGMSLRDYFAAKEKSVLTNLFWSNKSFQKSITEQAREEGKPISLLMCEMAYMEADIMLKRREL